MLATAGGRVRTQLRRPAKNWETAGRVLRRLSLRACDGVQGAPLHHGALEVMGRPVTLCSLPSVIIVTKVLILCSRNYCAVIIFIKYNVTNYFDDTQFYFLRSTSAFPSQPTTAHVLGSRMDPVAGAEYGGHLRAGRGLATWHRPSGGPVRRTEAPQ